MDDNSSKPTGILDNAAVTLSGLCLLHCLALPVLIAALPFLSQFSEEHFHLQMLAVVLPVSLVAFTAGFRRHRKRRIIAWGGAGMMLLVFGATVAHSSYGAVADRLVTICAVLMLAVTHYLNNRLSRHRNSIAILSGR